MYWMSTNRRSSASRSIVCADLELHAAVDVLLRRAEAVDARHARDDDDVAPGQQAHRRRVPQPLDLLVDRGVLLDVGVGLRDVGLGLVVVVVGDEVLDRVVRQQLAELVGQLRGEGLVRRHHQRRALQLLDQPGGRGGLAGAGRAEQDDVLLAARRSGAPAPRSPPAGHRRARSRTRRRTAPAWGGSRSQWPQLHNVRRATDISESHGHTRRPESVGS